LSMGTSNDHSDSGHDPAGTTDNVADPDALPETVRRTRPPSDSSSDSNPANVGTVLQNRDQADEDSGRSSPAPLNSPFEAIGRFAVREVLGRGGGGVVYRAFDEHLGRDVAIKVPHAAQLAKNAELAREYRHEARVVAQLDHDHIIRIYDVNSTDSLPCYLVTQFICGHALSQRMHDGGMTEEDSVELVVSMAEALQHATSQGVIHRDVKPGNILVDETGKPWLADFGLALDEDSLAIEGDYSGTPSYMSPEQAGGEGHRIDGRTDIFSLGIVLYELLTRKRPFRGDSTVNVLQSIRELDAQPLRQLDSSIAKELERICLKALARQISDRYTTAADFAEDLKLWQESQKPVATDVGATSTARATLPEVDTFVVPKGLRAFDEHDASFFLSLLPGARGRDGLPESVRFWKTRIEETDSQSTFSVGLVYGPSGCGKSSLIRAGVIPQLDPTVTAVYVESTPHDTETRILRSLKAAAGIDSGEQTLVELFQTVRRTGRTKVVLFVDQFEQWLQTHRDPDSELVRALRQCDGRNLQAVVMVRDDFWLAASRFMRELDIRIKEGDNSSLVDLFPLPHAERVLTMFGQARHDLPQVESDISDENRTFVTDAVTSLAQQEKVVCVRLALFAEMMRGKEWIPATLEKMGGTSGIGLTFLEETFSSPAAPIEHRVHQTAARNVLRSLLPVAGRQLKGHMVPVEQLKEESGYGAMPAEFDDLLLVLDQQLRLITPTDPLGQRLQEQSSPSDEAPEHGACYQLTHDYLVPTLREWLHLKQRETRRGRAELLLHERVSLWNDHQSGRQYLPSLMEWMRIRLFTKRKRWTDAERAMVYASDRRHLTRFAFVSTAVLLMAAGLFYLLYGHQEAIAKQQEKNDREETETLVTIMLGAPGFAYPYTRELVRPYQEYALEDVRGRLDDGGLPVSQDLHARLFLAGTVEVDVEYIVKAVRNCDSSECANIVTAIQPVSQDALAKIQLSFREAVDRSDIRTAARLAIVAICFGDTGMANELANIPKRPWPRTLLIKTFAEWNCELAELATAVESVEEPYLRSALCLGVGSIRKPGRDVTTAWGRVWRKWYVEHPDAGTHSASRWALQSWKLPVPDDLSADENGQRDWYHTTEGLVLVRIPAGKFSRYDSNA
jgi:serine/threonine protein kinase